MDSSLRSERQLFITAAGFSLQDCGAAAVCCAGRMSTLPSLPAEPRPGLYRHYKGNDYCVTGLAHHTETEEVVVVYQALYGARGLWVRPVEMFNETVEVNGKRMPRFARVGD